ncbi:hypothetical protein LXL04_029680 [Taraxacum kok-saghyz]
MAWASSGFNVFIKISTPLVEKGFRVGQAVGSTTSTLFTLNKPRVNLYEKVVFLQLVTFFPTTNKTPLELGQGREKHNTSYELQKGFHIQTFKSKIFNLLLLNIQRKDNSCSLLRHSSLSILLELKMMSFPQFQMDFIIAVAMTLTILPL